MVQSDCYGLPPTCQTVAVRDLLNYRGFGGRCNFNFFDWCCCCKYQKLGLTLKLADLEGKRWRCFGIGFFQRRVEAVKCLL